MSHGVAVTALPDHSSLGYLDFCIFLQCECGWRLRLGPVVTADRLTEIVAQHRACPVPL